MIQSNRIRLKRAYEKPEQEDGMRILVDRLWPRGVRKADAQIDVWLKDIAPSTELRKEFNHRPELFDAFTALYRQELTNDEIHKNAVRQLCEWVKSQPVTMVYAAKDEQVNHAVVLRQFISEIVD